MYQRKYYIYFRRSIGSNFNGNIVIFNTGDGLFIPAGEKDKHIGKALTKVIRMLFVDGVL